MEQVGPPPWFLPWGQLNRLSLSSLSPPPGWSFLPQNMNFYLLILRASESQPWKWTCQQLQFGEEAMDRDAERPATTTGPDPPGHLASAPTTSLIKELILAIVHGVCPKLGHSVGSRHTDNRHSSISSATQAWLPPPFSEEETEAQRIGLSETCLRPQPAREWCIEVRTQAHHSVGANSWHLNFLPL